MKRLLWHHLLSGIQDNLATQRIRSLVDDGPYIPWTNSTLSATAVATVLNDIVINQRSIIVECGSGVSSIFIGRLLKERDRPNTHLYTIEHDEGWAKIVRGMTDDYGLDKWVTVIHAPLRKTALSWNEELWYDTGILSQYLKSTKIDLLLVDGPPAHGEDIAYARYPAIPFFKDVLAERYSVILDDIDRKAEQEIVRIWEDILGAHFNKRMLDGNIAIGNRGNAFTV